MRAKPRQRPQTASIEHLTQRLGEVMRVTAAVAAPRRRAGLFSPERASRASLKELGLAEGGGPEGGRSIDETVALEFRTTTSSRQ